MLRMHIYSLNICQEHLSPYCDIAKRQLNEFLKCLLGLEAPFEEDWLREDLVLGMGT